MTWLVKGLIDRPVTIRHFLSLANLACVGEIPTRVSAIPGAVQAASLHFYYIGSGVILCSQLCRVELVQPGRARNLKAAPSMWLACRHTWSLRHFDPQLFPAMSPYSRSARYRKISLRIPNTA